MHRLLSLFLLAVIVAGAVVAADEAAESSNPRISTALDQLAAADTLAAIKTLRHTDLEGVGEPRWFALLGRLYRERGTIVSRLESQDVLERAVRIYPNDVGLALELGLTYFAQTFYPDAARYFERALELDPELCVARYKIGVTHYERWKLRVHAYQDEAEKARVWLARALSCDPGNVDAAVRYLNVTYTLDEPYPALQAAQSFAARFPESPEFPLMVGAIAYEGDQLVMADSAFTVALSLMTEEEAAAFSGLGRNVLGYSEMDEYEKASEEQRPLMERAYWIGADPDPTTDVNQGHLEHMYRTYRADLLYSHSSVIRSWTHPQIRGWDTERGEVYIKLGPPDHIYASHGGERFEVWRYDTGGEPITFNFMDRFGNGNLSVPGPNARSLATARYMDQVTLGDTSVVYVNGAMDAIAFKDDDFTCSVYTILHADADSMLRNIEVASTSYFVVRTRFFDEDWAVEKDDEQRIPLHQLAVLPGSKFRLFDVVRRHSMPFGRYHVACTLEDEAHGAQAPQRGVCDASHLASSRLSSSDILFLRDGMAGASFSRGGELLLPNPWRAYGTGRRVGVYFEIYNLAAVAGQSRYRVTYEIRENADEPPNAWQRMGQFVSRFVGKDGAPVVAQSFDRIGDGHRAGERMAIDVSVLPPGHHRLSLTIEDLHSGQRWETSRDFTKTAPAMEVANP